MSTDQLTPNLRALDILADGTDDELSKLITLRKNIFRYFGEDKLVELMVSIVDQNDIFSFVNQRAKKFINVDNPVFKLAIAIDQLDDSTKAFIANPDNSINDKYETVRDIIFSNIVDIFTSKMVASIENNDESLLDRIPDDNVAKKFIFMNAFNIRIEAISERKKAPSQLKIELRYLI